MKSHQTRFTPPLKRQGPFAETFQSPYPPTYLDAFNEFDQQGRYRDIFDPENIDNTIWHIYTHAGHPFFGLTDDDILIVNDLLDEIKFLVEIDPGQKEYSAMVDDNSLTITEATDFLSPDFHFSYNRVTLNINEITITWYFLLDENDAEIKDDKIKNIQKDAAKPKVLYEKSESNKVEGFNRNNTGYKFWWSDGRVMDHGDVENFINRKRAGGDKRFLADFPVVKEGELAPSYTIVGRTQPYFAYDKRLKDPYEDGDNLRSSLLSGSYYLEQAYDGHIFIGSSTKGESVDKIKEALNQIYENRPSYQTLILDGNYDKLTKSTVEKFQEENSLNEGANGVVGKETIRAMDSKLVSGELLDLPFEQVQELLDLTARDDEKEKEPDEYSSDPSISFGIGSMQGMGAQSLYSSKGTGGVTNLSTEHALSVLDNISKGQSPFKPELGKGGASWFTIEGSPYVGNLSDKPIEINVQIKNYSNPLMFKEADLLKIFNEKITSTAVEAELTWRTRNNKVGATLTPPQTKQLSNFKERFAESRMWDEVGRRAGMHPSKVAEVYIEQGSRFSTNGGTGKFVAIADPQLIEVKGGIEPIVTALTEQGLGKDPVLLEASEALRVKMKWSGNVRAAFRYGGKILLVLGIAADLYKIYRAEDKLKAVVESAGGWTGAVAGASAFAAWWTPADVAGPWAWVVHGVGTLVSGAIGYWIGSSTTRYIYELVAEEDSDGSSSEGTPMEGQGGSSGGGGSSNFGGFGGGSFGGGGSGGKW